MKRIKGTPADAAAERSLWKLSASVARRVPALARTQLLPTLGVVPAGGSPRPRCWHTLGLLRTPVAPRHEAKTAHPRLCLRPVRPTTPAHLPAYLGVIHGPGCGKSPGEAARIPRRSCYPDRERSPRCALLRRCLMSRQMSNSTLARQGAWNALGLVRHGRVGCQTRHNTMLPLRIGSKSCYRGGTSPLISMH